MKSIDSSKIRMVLLGFVYLTFVSISPAVAAVGFQGLGFLPSGDLSVAYGLSADGSTVVGLGSSGWGIEAFRWTQSTGMQGLGDLHGGSFGSEAWAVSADGQVVVGLGRSTPGHEAFRWTQSTQMQGLGDLPGGDFRSEARGVSADGSVVVGHSDSGSTFASEAFRWTQAGTMQGLGYLASGAHESRAYGVSADGSVVVGYSMNQWQEPEAFRWTEPTGTMQGLGDLPGGPFESKANAVSADGSVVVGYGSSSAGLEAFRWTASGAMQGLGYLSAGAFWSEALAVSADGSVVVGFSEHMGREAFIWDTGNGMRNLQDVLENNFGLNLTGWKLQEAWGISADGLTIAGFGENPSGYTEAWLATIPEPTTVALLGLGSLALLRRRRTRR